MQFCHLRSKFDANFINHDCNYGDKVYLPCHHGLPVMITSNEQDQKSIDAICIYKGIFVENENLLF